MREFIMNKYISFLEDLKQERSRRGYQQDVILIDTIEDLLRNARYGLVYEEHDDPIQEVLKTNDPHLVEWEERSVKNGPENSPAHILIEGDNLAALKDTMSLSLFLSKPEAVHES